MTSLLEQAVNAARNLPSHRQDEIAQIMLNLAGNNFNLVELTAEEDAAIALSIEAADRGEFASDEEVKKMWAKHGL
jgi:predicted transcriptional regulator